MPNEPVILHRVVIWDIVWRDEYCVDMALMWTSKALTRSRWTALQKDALVFLSKEYFGVDELDRPLRMLSLRERASHSNFAACSHCKAGRDAGVKF